MYIILVYIRTLYVCVHVRTYMYLKAICLTSGIYYSYKIYVITNTVTITN